MAKKGVDTNAIADACNALSSPHRAALMAHLAKNGPTTVNDLHAAIGNYGSISGVSQHLAKLAQAGAVTGVRDAQKIYYDAVPRFVQGLIDGLSQIAMVTEAKPVKKAATKEAKTETAELASALKASMKASAKATGGSVKAKRAKAEKAATPAPVEVAPIPKKKSGGKKKSKPVPAAATEEVTGGDPEDTAGDMDGGADSQDFTQHEHETDASGGGA